MAASATKAIRLLLNSQPGRYRSRDGSTNKNNKPEIIIKTKHAPTWGGASAPPVASPPPSVFPVFPSPYTISPSNARIRADYAAIRMPCQIHRSLPGPLPLRGNRMYGPCSFLSGCMAQSVPAPGTPCASRGQTFNGYRTRLAREVLIMPQHYPTSVLFEQRRRAITHIVLPITHPC